MSRQPSFFDLPNAISSPGSASGASPSGAPVGRTNGRSGQDRALASLSARQAQEMDLLTSGTFGRTGTGSSISAALTSSLASKLQAKTASGGTILYRLIWTELATPEGRSLPALRALGWSGGAAPKPGAWNGPYAFVPIPWLPGTWLPLPSGLIRLLESAESTSESVNTLSGWPTATAKGSAGAGTTDPEKSLARAKGPSANDLQDFVQLARWPEASGWSTASARDWKGSEGMALTGTNPDGSERKRTDQLPRQAQLAGWPTAMAGTPPQNGNSGAGNSDSTRRTMAMAGMEVPGSGIEHLSGWGPARITIDGEILTGSFAGMDSGGQLDPAHSRWLMRIPDEWDECAPTETASILSKRRRSPKP